MRLSGHPQGSPEWLADRVGLATASRAGDLTATIKSGEAAARRDYRWELICEQLTGEAQPGGFISEAMQRGTDMEPLARSAYEVRTGSLVMEAGFASHDTIAAGASVDGQIDDWTGLVEIKCPKTATHIRYLRAGAVPPLYIPQITHQAWITNAAWVDFVSFDDRLPEHLRLFVVRWHRDDDAIAAHAAAVMDFLGEVQDEVAALHVFGNPAAVAETA
jgi:predicted phage-related endonuclease